MKNLTIVCNYPSGKLSNAVMIKDAKEIEFKNVKFEGPAYNTIMTGQRCKAGGYLESLVIENCTFNELCRHINIWCAAWKNNAVVTIKNCKFATCEQFLCLGDFHAANDVAGFANKLTVNIENCEIVNYEKNDAYEGIILCDSRHATAANYAEVNPFANVTINITNTKVGDVLLTKDNFLMGTQAVGQMLYVYRAKDNTNFVFNADTKAFFPTVYVDGELIAQLA